MVQRVSTRIDVMSSQGPRGKKCEGVPTANFDCNMDPCDMQWSPWSECSAVCGRGMRRRQTMCALKKDGELKTCKELDLKSQDFEHIDNCNTWDKKTCSE